MSFQRKWLLAIPVVVVLMAMMWIVARPTEESASRSRSADAGITPPATASTPARTVRVTDSEDPEPAANATAILEAPTPARAREPGPSSVLDRVDLSGRASEVLVEPDDNSPLPPGYITPDLVTLPSANLFIGYDIEGTKYLHFENSILNLSLVPLEVHGTLNPRTNVTDVKQRIYAEDGAYVDRPIGSFFYHPDHEHWHIDAIAEYQLWSVDSEGLIGEPVVAARKASYCLCDDAHFSGDPHPESWPDVPVYGRCETVIQGITPGWIDIYDSNTPGQLIDITGLPDGAYALVSRANPDDVVYESDIRNNIAIPLIEISGDQVFLMRSMPKLPPAFFLS